MFFDDFFNLIYKVSCRAQDNAHMNKITIQACSHCAWQETL